MKKLIFFFVLFLSSAPSYAQMWNGTDTLYGNEWIHFDQSYYRILIAEDGVYRITYESLVDQGIPANTIEGHQFQLFHNGQEVPLYRSEQSLQSAGDYLEFCGKQNRSEMDTFLFKNPDDLLNPFYSMYTDSSAYFLTWSTTTEGLSFTPTNNELLNLPPKEEWFWYNKVVEFHSHPIHKTNFDGVAESIYDTGEGYAKNYSNNINVSIQAPFVANIDESSTLSIRLVSSHGLTHELEIDRNGSTIITESWSGTQLKEYTHQIASNELNETEELNIRGGTASNDRYALAVAQIRYPRIFDFDGASYFPFELSSSTTDQYIEIDHFNTSGGTPILYDLTNNLRLEAVIDNALLKFKLAPSSDTRALVLVAPNQITSVNTLESISFTNFEALSSDYIILSHPKLFAGNHPVQAYAEYRASTAGGGFDPMVVDVEQLYLQFGYGINRHPQSIRNFAQYIRKNWASPPRYFFIIGKGREYTQVRSNSQLSSDATASFAVPTFGRPGADNLLLATHDNSTPSFALGRLAATSLSDVQLYLEKVKGYEQLQQSTAEADRAWRKEIIHLGGGGNPSEQASIRTRLANMEEVIENNAFGGNVFTFTKTSSDPIQQSSSSLLTEKINNGTNIITFFGHAGTGSFDVSIDDPSTYQNKDKYPFVFSLGCLSGQMHSNVISIGERFVFQEDKGAIGFIATTGFGYITSLSNMHTSFYQLLGSDYYTSGIGEIMKATLEISAALQGIPNTTLNQQYSLDGDPAIQFHYFDGPDYTIDYESIQFSPKAVNARTDSFAFEFTIQNLGKASEDSLEVHIYHQFPDGSEYLLRTLNIEAPKYESTITTYLPVFGERSIGFNKYFVQLDPNNKIEEIPNIQAEQNNELFNPNGERGAEIYIFSNAVSPIYPNNYAIINSATPTLKASTADVFADEQVYIIEIDSTQNFNSPLKQRKEIYQKGGILEWEVPNMLLPSTTYYWRVSTDSTSTNGYQWANSSFIYIPQESEGWNQSHFFQFQENAFDDMELDESTRGKKYLDDVKSIRIRNGVYPNTWPEIAFGNSPFIYIPWDNPVKGGISVSVLDPVSIDYWTNNYPGDYESHLATPWAVDWGAFTYRTQDEDWRERAIKFLRDSIPAGHYVLVYSIQHTTEDYQAEEWAADSIYLGTNLFQVFEEQGANLIRNAATEGAKPWAFFYRKDDPSFPVYEEMVETNQELNHSLDIAGLWDNGSETTINIGPAKNWDKLQWAMNPVEASDDFQLNLWGVREDSTSSILAENIINLDTTLQWVNAEEFPFLRLQLLSSDEENRTAPQLDYWRIFYEGIPEIAINPNAHFLFQKDTVLRGEMLKMELALENLSNYNMDSVRIAYQVSDAFNNNSTFTYHLPVLPSKDTIIHRWNLDTKSLSGDQQITINLNPNQERPELFSFNNVGIKDFYIQEDEKNPILNVSFDGRYIINGDIISPHPLISISLKDENPFLQLVDTSSIRVFIKFPNELDALPVSYDQGNITFYPALSGTNNTARIEYQAEFLEDGTYEMIVQAQDASGNQSGRYDYKVSFEVIRENRISNVLNYPNPFSTATQFVYTLTGTEAPDDFVIQIMTVSGRVVRELTQLELGPLQIGTHRTSGTWDGTDQYGSRLANGVYLYRVLIQDNNGEAYEKYDNGTDRFFKNDLGKLVILR